MPDLELLRRLYYIDTRRNIIDCITSKYEDVETYQLYVFTKKIDTYI